MTDLHPDLAACIEPMERGGMQMLRHPLVYSVPYFGGAENERLNQLYEFRKKTLKECLQEGAYERYIFNHERPYRLDALMALIRGLTQSQVNPLILSVYVDSENISANYDIWSSLFVPLVGNDPWNTINGLPEEQFIIYRGGSRDGFSWTLDLDRARWFASRWSRKMPVWEATVTKEDVVGYYDGRGEKEVIVHPDFISHLIDKLEED